MNAACLEYRSREGGLCGIDNFKREKEKEKKTMNPTSNSSREKRRREEEKKKKKNKKKENTFGQEEVLELFCVSKQRWVWEPGTKVGNIRV